MRAQQDDLEENFTGGVCGLLGMLVVGVYSQWCVQEWSGVYLCVMSGGAGVSTTISIPLLHDQLTSPHRHLSGETERERKAARSSSVIVLSSQEQ